MIVQPDYAAKLLTNKIKKDYADDIAVVVIYGSAIYNDTHSRSDLDLFFVPKTERGYRLGFTFIVDGIGFDFWPISWDRLERIANHDERITSIITEGKVIYSASDSDRDHFNEMKKKALDTSDRNKFLDKASAKLNEAYRDLYCFQKAKALPDIRKAAITIAYSISDVLALLNRAPIKRGRGKLKAEIMNMPLLPERFSELYDTAFFSNDFNVIKQAFLELFDNTQELLLSPLAVHVRKGPRNGAGFAEVELPDHVQ
jgi:predicted nucleic acid-binding protein